MSIKIQPDTSKQLINSIQRFFSEKMDDDIGELKAQFVLDFFIKEIGPSIYNQAIADAQSYLQDRLEDLGAVKYEAEFDYWKK